MRKNPLFLLATAIWLLVAPNSIAQTVSWGTSVSLAGNPQLFLPDGSPMGASYQWELGWFDAGFVPTMSNAAQWAAAWHVVDTATVLGSPDYVVSGHKPDVGVAARGKQAWIWAFNNKAAMGQPSGSALLVTASQWLFPGELDFVTFDLAGDANDPNNDTLSVVMGRVDRDTATASPILCSGVIPIPMPDSASPDYLNVTFEAQAATWPGPTQQFADQWQATQFTAQELSLPSISAWSADPDADGMNNLLEYAYGTNPKLANAAAGGVNAWIADDHMHVGLALSPSALVKAELMETSDFVTWQPSRAVVLQPQPQLQLRTFAPLQSARRFYRVSLTRLLP